MFMGEYQHALDEKGRLIIPVKFREELGESFIVAKGLDNCLFVYPKAEWEILANKVKNLSLAQSEARAFVRFLVSGAMECELDKQGRIVLPPGLRQHAQIDKEVHIIGVTNRVEIWSDANWENYFNKAAESYEQVAEKIVDLGI